MASTERRRSPSSAHRRTRKAPLLAPDVSSVDFKDTNLLRTFLSDRGKIRARRITGITPQQQRLVTRAIKNAREMALLPYAGQR